MERRLSTQKQIAKELGISSASVSNALNGKGRLSPDLTQKVLEAARRLGYTPSAASRALKTGRTGIVGMVVPDITLPVYPAFAKGLEIAAAEAGYGLLISNAKGGGQDEAIQQLERRGVDGIVIIPHSPSTPAIPKIPYVIISTESDPMYTCASDHVQGGRLAAREIIRLGHRDVILLGDNPKSLVQNDRLKGMTDALEGQIRYQTIWHPDEIGDLQGRKAEGTTAILALSDLLALQVLAKISACDMQCPRDFSVMGFDNLALSELIYPTLSTISGNAAELSRHAIATLAAMIADDQQPAERLLVEMSAVMRGSTRSVCND